ncbi:MAG TPA: PilN domain-containing protein [Methylomirabilota bacterium]|nr:PilN domain-containing protein [Methylomirabilota bacterium]
MAIKVNLLHREDRPKRAGAGLSGISMPKIAIGGGRVMQIAGVLVIVVIVGLGWMGYSAWREKNEHEREITRLKAQDAQLQRQLTELRVADAAKREIQRRLDIIGRVAKSQGVPVQMMTGVLKSVPQGVWLTSVDMKPQEVKVKVDATRPAISYSSETLAKLEQKKEESGTAKGPVQTREVTEIQGFSVVIKGMAFNNFQVAEFMENLRKAGVFSDVDFTVTQAANVEQVRVMDFEVTASVKL